MAKKVYRVWQETCETRTKHGEKWTEEELLDDYFRRCDVYYNTLKDFDTYEQAKKFFDETEPSGTTEQKTNTGYVLLYEVIGIEELEQDYREDISYMGQTDIKTSPYDPE